MWCQKILFKFRCNYTHLIFYSEAWMASGMVVQWIIEFISVKNTFNFKLSSFYRLKFSSNTCISQMHSRTRLYWSPREQWIQYICNFSLYLYNKFIIISIANLQYTRFLHPDHNFEMKIHSFETYNNQTVN